MFRGRLRAATRILVGVVFLGTLSLGALAMALTQPVVGSVPFQGRTRANSNRIKADVLFLASTVGPRTASHPDNLAKAASYITRSFRATGARTYVQSFEARGSRYCNVVAEFGPDSDDPVLIIGAHYDSFGAKDALPGADDNASGTAGLIELARLLGSHAVSRPVMLVAFSTEEPPFFGSDEMGSALHARSLAASGRRIRGMICLEMIGYFSPDQTWPNALFSLLYPSTGDFIGVVGGWDDRELTRHVKRSIRGSGGIRVVSFTGPRETSDASDQRNYWRYGYTAVMVTDTAFLRNPNYHTLRDRPDTLNYDKMARVVDGVLNAVLSITAG